MTIERVRTTGSGVTGAATTEVGAEAGPELFARSPSHQGPHGHARR